MIRELATLLFKLGSVPVLCISLSGAASAQEFNFFCEDDEEAELVSNVTGTQDKIVHLDVDPGSNHDEDFYVVVYPEGHPEQITSMTHFTEGNEPPVTVPPGNKAKIVDKVYQPSDPPSWSHDGGQKNVSGSYTISSS